MWLQPGSNCQRNAALSCIWLDRHHSSGCYKACEHEAYIVQFLPTNRYDAAALIQIGKIDMRCRSELEVRQRIVLILRPNNPHLQKRTQYVLGHSCGVPRQVALDQGPNAVFLSSFASDHRSLSTHVAIQLLAQRATLTFVETTKNKGRVRCNCNYYYNIREPCFPCLKPDDDPSSRCAGRGRGCSTSGADHGGREFSSTARCRRGAWQRCSGRKFASTCPS